MEKYTSDINNLFNSTGFFPDEYTSFLDELPIEEQSIFITELYKRVTTEQYQRQQGKDQFGVKIVKGKRIYRFSEDDLEQAKKLQPLVGETLLKAIGEEKDCLKYQATYVFHERKREEIAFEAPEIERLYRSIVNRVQINNSIERVIDHNSIYKDTIFNFLEFPPDFTVKKLTNFLKEHDFESCFVSREDFRHFKTNSFKLLAERKYPLTLNFLLTKESKKAIAKKMYLLYYKYKKQRKDYSELDLSKSAFAKVLMYNFSEFRNNIGNNKTFEGILANVTKKIRP